MLRKRFLDLLRTPLPHFLEKPHTLNYQTNYYFGFLATKQEKKKLLKDEKIFQNVFNSLNRTGIANKEEYNTLNKLISSYELSHDDIKMILRTMHLLKKNPDQNQYKKEVQTLVDSTSQSILKIPKEKLMRSELLMSSISDLISYGYVLGYKNNDILNLLYEITAFNPRIFKDLEGLLNFLMALTNKDHKEINQSFLKQLFSANEDLMLKSLKEGSNPIQNVNKVITALHMFNRLQLELELLDSVISVIMKEHKKAISGKHLGYLIRMILRNEKSFTKYSEEIKPLITAHLEHLDLMACSQTLYAFYRIAVEIEHLGLSLVQTKQICDHIIKLLHETKNINHLTNKAITGILVFMREFLYDDVYLLAGLIDTVNNAPGADINTYITLIHTIGILNAQEFYKFLPKFYELCLAELKKEESYNLATYDFIKMAWNTMAVTQTYDEDFAKFAIDLFLKDGLKIFPTVSLKPILISVYEGLLFSNYDEECKAKLWKLKEIIEHRYKAKENAIKQVPPSDTLFQDQIAEILTRNAIKFEKEKFLEIFFADYFIPDSNTILECIGPVHFTLFKKRYQGTIDLRFRILSKQGYNIALINYDDWLLWRQHNTAQENVLKLLKIQPSS